MAFVTDPDSLDRFQVAIDPVYKVISLRGSGTPRFLSITGSGNAAGELCDTGLGGGGFGGSGANVNDLVAIVNDPGNDKGIIGHYKITAIDGGNDRVTLDRAITETSSSGIAYAVFASGDDSNGAGASLSDGVTMQALYSFLKEEWRVNSLDTGAVVSGEDLIKFTFPMVSITSEQFEIGGVVNQNWDFADDSGDGALASKSPRNLIRTGGWASINTSGQIIENYPSIITLGSIDATNAQVYYQLTSATTNPENFVLKGPVNQSIRTLETIGGATVDGEKRPVSGVSQSDISFTAPSTIDAGSTNLYALGFTSGELIQVRNAAANNGLFTIASSGAGATFVTVSETITTQAAGNATLSPLLDNRDYLVLRVRTKGKSYAQSEIADIGVTQINTIVNRFPLAEADDPAITLDDGAINGDGTNETFQVTTSVTTGTDGDFIDNGDGTIEFTAASKNWTTTNNVEVGDVINITGPASNPNIGFYEISVVAPGADNTKLTLIAEPAIIRAVDTTTDDGVLEYTARTRVQTLEQTDGVTADIDGDTGGLSSASAAFVTDGIPTGGYGTSQPDVLRIKSGTNEGFYPVVSGVTENNLVANTLQSNSVNTDIPKDQTFTSDTGVTFDVLLPGMHLQYKKQTSNTVTNCSASANVITSAAGELQKADGYYVGTVVTLTGTTNSTDGQYLVTATTNDNDITLANLDNPNNTPTITGSAITVTGEYGFVRKLGDFHYSFNWKLYGNKGTLQDCFQFLQKQLRLTSDIDEGAGTSRGDITDLLMTFASPNGTTLNLFIDDVLASEFNNLTQQDVTGNNRNFPFLVALNIALNANILNSAPDNKVVVFFSDAVEANDDRLGFGTPDAVIVPDSDGNDMTSNPSTGVTSSPLTFQYNYDDAGVNRDITIVCISLDTGQYVSTTAVLTRSNSVEASLVAGLERNYSNP